MFKKIVVFALIMAPVFAGLLPVEVFAQPSAQTGQTRGGNFIPLITPITGGGAQCNTAWDTSRPGCYIDPCTTCHLVALARNILETLIALAVILAIIIFIYAGWIYLTTAIQDRIQKAHRMFWQVFVGLVVVLAAWLIVDTGLRIVANPAVLSSPQNLLPGSQFLCDPSAFVDTCKGQGFRGGGRQNEQGGTSSGNTTTLAGGGTSGGQTGSGPVSGGGQGLNVCPSGPNPPAGCVVDPTGEITHDAAIAALDEDITVTSTGNPNVQAQCPSGGGCTSLDGVRGNTIAAANQFEEECGCNLVITGGTESGAGHAAGNFSHENGYKLDFDDTTEADLYFQGANFTPAGTRSDGAPLYTRDVMLNGEPYQVVAAREGTHWDVGVEPQ